MLGVGIRGELGNRPPVHRGNEIRLEAGIGHGQLLLGPPNQRGDAKGGHTIRQRQGLSHAGRLFSEAHPASPCIGLVGAVLGGPGKKAFTRD